MFHRYWLKNVSAYLDKELSDTKKQKVESHLKECKICQSHLAEWKRMETIQKEFPTLHPEETIWYAISQRMKQEPVRPLHFWEDDWVMRYIPNPVPAVVAAILVLLLVVGFQPYFKTPDSSSETLEQYLSNEIDSTTSTNIDNFISLANNS